MNHHLHAKLDVLDLYLARFLAHYSLPFLRLSMGVIFLWFGALKFIPGASPAEDLALRTMGIMTSGLVPELLARILLASLECAIGLGFLTGGHMRLTLLLLFFQMAGALSPLVLLPEEVFGATLLTLTLEGQYLIKNLVLIGAGMVIGATWRGGRIVAEPSELTDNRSRGNPSRRTG